MTDTSTEAVERLAQWIQEVALYFERRPTGGEDRAHWANVANAKTARKHANTIRALAAERDAAPSRGQLLEVLDEIDRWRSWVSERDAMLQQCLNQFREYERLHLAKSTPDGLEKADRNAKIANDIAALLDGDRCEWDAVNNVAALDDGTGCPNAATVSVGSLDTWHVCASCAALPAFQRYRKRTALMVGDDE